MKGLRLCNKNLLLFLFWIDNIAGVYYHQLVESTVHHDEDASVVENNKHPNEDSNWWGRTTMMHLILAINEFSAAASDYRENDWISLKSSERRGAKTSKVTAELEPVSPLSSKNIFAYEK